MSGLAEVLQPLVWSPSSASLGIDLGCNRNKMKIGNMKCRGGTEFGDGWVNGIIIMTNRMDEWTR